MAAPTISPASIVVVDDEPEVLHIVSAFLSEVGHHVDVAQNGPDALCLLDRRGFDLAILDIRMPFMDGFELCARIRANEQQRRLPILFLSAHYEDREWSVRARDLGADDFALKPITRRALCARVATLLRLARPSERGPSLAMRAFFETMLDGLPACVLALSSHGQVLDVAGRVEETLGAAVTVGMPLQQALPPCLATLAGGVRQLFAAALGGTGEASNLFPVHETTGVRFLKLTVRRMPARSGGPIRAVLVIEQPRGGEMTTYGEQGVVDLQVTELAAAAADLAGAIETRSVDVLRSLRVLGETGERVLRIAESIAAATHGMEQQVTLATLRAYWRSALKESALGAHGIVKLARELRGGSGQ